MSDLNNQMGNSSNSFVADAGFELPPEKNVIFYNDDITTMDFVVEVLVSIFNKAPEDAHRLMMQVHENGSSVVGTYTYDIAVSRTNLTIQVARKNGFPLRVEVE